MRRLPVLAALVLALVRPEAGRARGETFVYASAATDRRIVVYRLDPGSGALAEVQQVDTPGEPGPLVVSPDRTRLVASLRAQGKLAGFRRDPASGRLEAADVVDAGADPAHLGIDPTGRFVFTAYYVAAKVSLHDLGPDGSPGARPRQEIPTAEKAHAASLDPSGRWLIVPHTGPDRIFVFRWDGARGRLEPADPPSLATPVGTGPRHVAWHPSRPVAYVINEQGGSVTAYRFDADKGRLEPVGTRSTLPEGFEGRNACSEIKVHPSGRFLYAANRGHDSLAVFRLDESGERLTPAGHVATEANPRSFDLDPSGRFLIAGGEGSGRLVVYRVDAEGGGLEPVQRAEVGPRLWWVLAVEGR